jgi:hypothetical protein
MDSSVRAMRLVPGHHQYLSGFGYIDFMINSDGTIGFDPAMSSYVDGAGSTTLIIRGLPVTVDVTQLSNTGYYLAHDIADQLDNTTAHAVRLLPGRHEFVTGFATIFYTVTPDGRFDYDPALGGFVSGAGTTTLVVRGLPVTVDVTQLSNSGYYLAQDIVAPFDNTTAHTVRLMPGLHEFVSGYVTFFYTVTADGRFEYDSSMSSYLDGSGTTTLVVRGLPVTIDATRMAGAFFLANDVGTQFDNTVHVVRLLPGQHFFFTTALSFFFTVQPDGTVDYDPGLTGVSGRGTSTLVVPGP